MAFKEKGRDVIDTLTSLGAWQIRDLETVVTSSSKFKVRNLFVRGTYNIDQTTEVNSQHGLLIFALWRFPDTVTTPDPDIVEGNSGGIDRQILAWRYVWASGQNNPVLWTFKYRAVNINPGQKLSVGVKAQRESGTSINHRVNWAMTYWLDEED